MIRQKTAGAAQPRRCCGRPGWPRPCVITNPCRGRCLHRPANLAAAGTVLASLVKGRWPSEARTEGLFRLEMPLTEGGAFWRGPGGGSWWRGNPPVCGLCPQPAPFDKGACSVRILGAARIRGPAATRTTVGRGALTPPDPEVVQTPAGGMNPAPTNKFYVAVGRDGRGRAL